MTTHQPGSFFLTTPITGSPVTGVRPRSASGCGCAACGEQRARDTTAADWQALNAAVRAHAHDRSGVTPWGA